VEENLNQLFKNVNPLPLILVNKPRLWYILLKDLMYQLETLQNKIYYKNSRVEVVSKTKFKIHTIEEWEAPLQFQSINLINLVHTEEEVIQEVNNLTIEHLLVKVKQWE
jgi:hypothetical protein